MSLVIHFNPLRGTFVPNSHGGIEHNISSIRGNMSFDFKDFILVFTDQEGIPASSISLCDLKYLAMMNVLFNKLVEKLNTSIYQASVEIEKRYCATKDCMEQTTTKVKVLKPCSDNMCQQEKVFAGIYDDDDDDILYAGKINELQMEAEQILAGEMPNNQLNENLEVMSLIVV